MIKLAFVGDIMPGGLMVYEGRISDNIKELLHSFDFRIGTLETAFGDGSNICHIKLGNPKLGTAIYSPDSSISILKELNINAVTIANNHSCDCDIKGLYHTIDLLNQNDILYFGGGKNHKTAHEPGYIKIKNQTICFLGYYQAYSYLGKPYIPSEQVGGLNIYNENKVLEDIKKYKQVYDYIFVMPHWGTELSYIPKKEEEKAARKFIEAGATAVIGSHTHTVQSIVKYKNGVIAMSLGNFVFPDRYINTPRITVYPDYKEIVNKNIPESFKFPFVKELTCKRILDKYRIGVICEIIIDGKNISFKRHYTRLTKDHQLVLTDISKKQKLLYSLIGLMIKDRTSFIHRVYNLIIRIKKIISNRTYYENSIIKFTC